MLPDFVCCPINPQSTEGAKNRKYVILALTAKVDEFGMLGYVRIAHESGSALVSNMIHKISTMFFLTYNYRDFEQEGYS